jgi:rhamnosyl/mannosyltransferase
METTLSLLCESLTSRFDVSVIVASRFRGTTAETINGVSVTRAGSICHVAGAPINLGLPGLIRKARPDLIHLHVPHPGAVLALLVSDCDAPVVISYHSDVVRQRTLNLGFQYLTNRILRRSTRIIAGSEQLVKSSGVLRKFAAKCQVIPFAADQQQLQCPLHLVQEIRSRYPGPLILAVGRLVYYKGFEWLIRAMRHVSGTLLIIGEGPDRAELERIAAQGGANNSVHLLGGIEFLAPYYQAADVFVLPSVAPSEAFGLVQLEAMACGKPVINTWLESSVPYVSLDGITGLTVAPRDEMALANAINLLLNQPDLRAQYGQAARQRFEDEYTVDRMVDRVAAVYDAVLS